jgi:uncharacterized NAD(P)/FAD-binding protein YdhS
MRRRPGSHGGTVSVQATASSPLRVAIVGGGPRGLSALEVLARHAGCRSVNVTLFERGDEIGCGPNYAPGQSDLNLLNIPVRAIDLPPPPQGASFKEWLAAQRSAPGEDGYPPRPMLGAYLQARLQALLESERDGLKVEIVAQEVVHCRRAQSGWLLWTRDMHDKGPFDEVLLCSGHQPVEDSQIERWRDHARKSDAVLAPAYPGNRLLEAADWSGRTVAIRGFGLAMIDTTRMLTEGLGGRFETDREGGLVYRASGREPARLVPFSLNGMPPAPKPATGAIDSAFAVTDAQRAEFRETVAAAIDAGDGSLEPIFRVLGEIAGPKLGKDGSDRVLDWLCKGAEDDPDVPDDQHPAEAMRLYLAMAHGEAAPSVGYATGQVWRHLQNDLRKAYNPAEKAAATAGALIAFDDGMKRFSYGPPAEATARLLALIDAGKLTLRRVDDPDIELIDSGWRIAENGGADIATAMVDSVLAGPDLANVSSPLISGLRDDGYLVPLDEKLGARTSAGGQVVDADGRPVDGLSLLGRLANGSVIATDSVHDCFGAAVERWAARVLGG